VHNFNPLIMVVRIRELFMAEADLDRGRQQGQRNRALRWMTIAIVLVWGSALVAQDQSPVDFEKEIAPLLSEKCLGCHSDSIEKGDFSLSSLKKAVDSGMLIPGDVDGSALLDAVAGSEDSPAAMPKKGDPLTPEQVEMLRRWVAEGATWPEDIELRETSRADASWWSLQPLSVVSPPVIDSIPEPWNTNPIDQFVFAKFKENALSPNAVADKRTLIRRATYDLIGLPPTLEEIANFIADTSPDAFAKVVDRLLASPHYGEHWGRHWLDVVRFGESNGYERNVAINDIWPFRDYVIQSMNEDKPFDLFIREHLAGDVFDAGNPDAEIATAFLVAGPYDDVGNQDPVQAAQIRADSIDEMIRASSEAFFGLTVGCSRCHDHKFDPILQSDYYSLYATFSGVKHDRRVVASPAQHAERTAKLQALSAERNPLVEKRDALNAVIKARTDAGESGATPEETQQLNQWNAKITELDQMIAAVPTLPVVFVGSRNAGGHAGPFHIFLGGSPQKKGKEVHAVSMSALSNGDLNYSIEAGAPESDRRLALANWIVQKDNPLPQRVLANRVWHYHFGTGIVNTPSDFGYMGGQPSHPELLDWLANQLLENDWKLKPLHRMIMLSQTYQQSSHHRDDAAKVDGGSRLLWRFPPRRLSAEEIRDSILHISGKLDTRAGGPGFRLYHFFQDNVCQYTPLDKVGPETYRRGVYHQNVRASVVDLMSDFDQPDCAFSTPRRASTTTPLQALTMLNHSFTLDMATSLSDRLETEAGDDSTARVQHLYELCYSRKPTPAEQAACLKFVDEASWSALCRVMFNTSELIYLK